ncbi:MAG: transglycosylase domain-containing protein [Lentimicrobiaceae bacterium]|nr:transglycosylase domain-containing protein [Lentimicrobiaceae bacterium]
MKPAWIYKVWNICKYLFKRFIAVFFGMPRSAVRLWEKLVVRLAQGILIFLMLVLAVDFNLFNLFGPSPDLFELKNPRNDNSSRLYSADGKLIGRYYVENRSPLEGNSLSPVLVHALLSAEDIRFYHHHGIDLKATAAAFYSTLRGNQRGGSTITQQLIKNLYKTRTSEKKGILQQVPGLGILISKTKEYISSIKMETLFSKDQILSLYLNTVDFGSNSFGIVAASETFFNKHHSNLLTQEAALLVGLLKAPTYYSPVLKPRNALKRRNDVLFQMANYGFISQHESDSLSKLPLSLKFNQYLQDEDAAYVKAAVAHELKSWCKSSGYNIYRDGLKIYTSIDPELQKQARDAMHIHMKSLQEKFDLHWQGRQPWVNARGETIEDFIETLARQTPAYATWLKHFNNNHDSAMKALSLPHKMTLFSWSGQKDTLLSSLDSIAWYARILNSGMVSIDPTNGHIKAWIGGIDYRYFKYDHVNQTRRQPGSLFKAFVYAAAFEKGLGPCDRRIDKPYRINYLENGEKKVWAPQNANWVFSGKSLTLKSAFAQSINSVAVQLTAEIGWDKIAGIARRFGIRSPLKNVPSIGLGSSEVTLLEMVNAYAALANRGEFNQAVLVTKITTHDDKVLYLHKPHNQRVLSENDAFLMEIMLRSGLTEPGGTTQGLWSFDLFRYQTDFGGKTGTSSNFADGWFVGVTPRLVTGIWVGGEYPSVHFRTSQTGEALRTALPLFGIYMQSVMQNENLKKYRGRFAPPPHAIDRPYKCSFLPPPNPDSTMVSGIAPANN